MVKQKIISKLRELTKTEFIEIVKRGNSAIDSALSLVRGEILIPEEGGWIHYKKGPEKLGIQIKEVKCKEAVIDLKDLERKVKTTKAFLYENPGGYFAEQPVKEIYKICKENNCLVILDVSGAIGTPFCDGTYADIIIGSFGRWKPINAEGGGFVATHNKELSQEMKFDRLEDEVSLLKIFGKVESLPGRLRFLAGLRDKVINDLKGFDLVKKDDFGLVVIVKFTNLEEKERIINYCNRNKLLYEECPRYIRINEKAISIEIKKMEEEK